MATSQESHSLLTATRSWKRLEGSSPRDSRRRVACQYLDFRFLDSRASKEYIFIVLSYQFVAFCYSNPRKLIYWVLPESKFRHEFLATWLAEWPKFIIYSKMDLPWLILCRHVWICWPSVLVTGVDKLCLPRGPVQVSPAILMAPCELFICVRDTQTQWKGFRVSFKRETILSICLYVSGTLFTASHLTLRIPPLE